MALLVLVGACGTQPPQAATSSPTPIVANHTPASGSPTALALTCSLPFFLSSDQSPTSLGPDQKPMGQIGFIRFPGGTFTPDPAAGFVADAQGLRTVAKPTLRAGFYGISFDLSAGRWLPVPESDVSPDGRHYVYARRQDLVLVDVATGVEKVLYHESSPTGLFTLGFKSEGIYVEVPPVLAPPDRLGLYLVDPITGTDRRLFTGKPDGFLIGDGAIWDGSVDGGLIRTDIATGGRKTWFAENGRAIVLLGVDLDGLPIVETYGDGLLEVWHVTAAGAGVKFYSMTYTGNPPIHDPVVVDGHGVWFGSTTGVYLYSRAGFVVVANAPGWPLAMCA